MESPVPHYIHKEFIVHSESDVIPDSVYRVYIYICNLMDADSVFKGSVLNINFPDNVHTLEFGDWLREDIRLMKFPKNLRKLVTGDYWSLDISGLVVPEGVHTIVFGDKFDSDLSSVTFPSTLCTVRFGGNFNVSGINYAHFPESLHTIDITMCFYHDYDTTVFPSHVKRIVVCRNQKGLYKLPEGCVEVVPKWNGGDYCYESDCSDEPEKND